MGGSFAPNDLDRSRLNARCLHDPGREESTEEDRMIDSTYLQHRVKQIAWRVFFILSGVAVLWWATLVLWDYHQAAMRQL